MKKFLERQQPNNILTFLDKSDGVDDAFIMWYRSNKQNQTWMNSRIVGFIVWKRQIPFRIADMIYDISKVFRRHR